MGEIFLSWSLLIQLKVSLSAYVLQEINNGRLAMLAIAVFAAQEFLGNSAVVNMFPQFFTAGPLANIG